MTDRKPTYPHRVQVTKEDGSQEIVTWEYADNPLVEGTPLSKANLLDDATGNLILPEVEDPTVNQALAALGKKTNALGSVTVSLPASGWQGGEAPYTQTVAVEKMTEEWIPGPPLAVPDGAALRKKYAPGIFLLSSDPFGFESPKKKGLLTQSFLVNRIV